MPGDPVDPVPTRGLRQVIRRDEESRMPQVELPERVVAMNWLHQKNENASLGWFVKGRTMFAQRPITSLDAGCREMDSVTSSRIDSHSPASGSCAKRFQCLLIVSLMLVMGLVSSSALAGQPSFSAVQAEVAAREGVSPHRIIVTSITLERTEVIGDTIIEHYRYGYLILTEQEEIPYEPSTLDEAQTYFDQRQHAMNLHAYYASYGALPSESQGLAVASNLEVTLFDPWSQPYEYQLVSDYEAMISSPGEDGIKGTEDDLKMPVRIDPLVEGVPTDAEVAMGLLLLFACVGFIAFVFIGLIVAVTITLVYAGKKATPIPLAAVAE